MPSCLAGIERNYLVPDRPTPLFAPGLARAPWQTGGSTPCPRIKVPLGLIILPGGGGLPPLKVQGDECRVLAETPPGTPHPDYSSGFEFIATESADWGVSELQVTTACVPVPLNPTRTTNGITATWVDQCSITTPCTTKIISRGHPRD